MSRVAVLWPYLSPYSRFFRELSFPEAQLPLFGVLGSPHGPDPMGTEGASPHPVTVEAQEGVQEERRSWWRWLFGG